jgi:two-component sensor histidine kinase/FixJ family two-component response regulator/PAS domain-containing protein
MNMQSRPVRVLLIDDDQDDYIMVRELLSDISHRVFILKWVSDYRAALDAILSNEFDVCLLDYRLKERNGLELMQAAVSCGAMTPIVFLSGQGGYDLDLEAMSKGAADWLTKGELSATLLERSIRYAMERQRRKKEQIKARRVIQALSECNNVVIRIKDEAELLCAICRIVVDVGGYRMAWVGYAEEDSDKTVTPVAKYGYEKDYLETVKVTWEDAERGRGPVGTCIFTGLPSVIRSVGTQAEFAPWKVEASKRGYASVIGLPLLLDGRKLGALTIYSSETDAFDTEEVEFLVKLSSNLSYGVGVLRLRKAQMQAEESLKEANLYLEERVEERTAELLEVNVELRKEVEERKRAEDAVRVSLRFLEIVHEHREIAPLLREYVAEIKNYTGCDAVGIRVLDENLSIPYQAYQGFSREFYESESPLSLKSDECMCINVIRGDIDPRLPVYTKGGGFCVNATSRFLATVSEEEKGRTRNRCNMEGYETVALFPFRNEGEIFGLIHVADHRENMAPPNVVKMLEKAALQLGTAFQSARTEGKLRESEQHYRSLFDHMLNGVAYCRMHFDQNRPTDFTYLNVNNAFETLTGLRDVIGKTVSEVIPGLPESDPELLELYGRVAVTGNPERFETYVEALGMWFSISVYSPLEEHFVAVFDVITERKRTEIALRNSFEEKVALLKEVHHRVKNNLQIVASLLNLQSSRARNRQVVDVLHDTRNRVHSMALLHDVLYRSGNLARINFAAYVTELCTQLVRSFGPAGARVKVENRVARIGLPLEQSVPCGLIINELVSNALKHGFPDNRTGRITVELGPAEGQRHLLCVRDDGIGLPHGMDIACKSTLGLQLVSQLAIQLGGQLEMHPSDEGGAAFCVSFPVPGDTAFEDEA